MTELRVRDATEADLSAVLTIRSRSFGPLGTSGEGWWRRISDQTLSGRMLVVVDGDRVLASGRIRPYQQGWGGRHLPMGGVAGVYVDPAARGRGVGSLLVRGLVSRMAELGDVVSCLYPTAPALYRAGGYEFGGAQHRVTYAADELRALRLAGGDANVRAAGPADADVVYGLARRHQERNRQSGPMLATAEAWREQLDDAEMIHYLTDDGFVAYSVADEVLTVETLVAQSPASTAALWSVVGSGSSAAPVVRAWLDPRDPVALTVGAVPARDVHTVPWMLRVIDLADAFAARGFASALTASAPVQVTDAEVPGNTGRWTFAVSNGRGKAVLERPSSLPARVTHSISSSGQASSSSGQASSSSGHSTQPGGGGSPSSGHSTQPGAGGSPSSGHAERQPGLPASGHDDEPVRLGPRGLAALWCGWPMSRLRQAGLATGGSLDGDSALDAIFACQPFMTEYF